MPVPALAIAGISAGANLLGQGLNAYSQTRTNQQQLNFSREMYARQRADSLADYHMQNEYNHPSSQMQRLRDAKLNPNLVYGNGTQTQATSIRSANAPAYNPQAPRFDPGSAAAQGISTYQDLQLREAQTDLLREQITTQIENRKLTAINTAIGVAKEAATWTDVHQKEFKLGQDRATRLESQDIIRESLKKLKADIYQTSANTTYTQNQDRRAESMNTATLAQIQSNIASQGLQNAKTKAETRQVEITMANLTKSGILQDLEIAMKRKGMSFSDPAWQRQLSEAWNNPQQMIPTFRKFLERLRK